MRSVVRWNDRGEAQLLQLSIYLVISAMLGVMAFHFVRPMFHGAHVTQMETVVNNLRTAAGNYAEVNGSYGNISCATLQNAGLWPPNGCNGPVGGGDDLRRGEPVDHDISQYGNDIAICDQHSADSRWKLRFAGFPGDVQHVL